MRRWFLILILFVMPTQFAWALAGDFCEHESGKAAHHFGHHDHEHQVDSKGDPSKSPQNTDNDCSTCLAGHVVAPPLSMLPLSLIAAPIPHGPVDQLATSAPLSLPERPNWSFSV